MWKKDFDMEFCLLFLERKKTGHTDTHEQTSMQLDFVYDDDSDNKQKR